MVEWRESDGQLQAICEFSSFSDAWGFVNKLASLAEAHQHHPDILWQYTRVVLRLSTHDANGAITDKDHQLATAISEIL